MDKPLSLNDYRKPIKFDIMAYGDGMRNSFACNFLDLLCFWLDYFCFQYLYHLLDSFLTLKAIKLIQADVGIELRSLIESSNYK